MKKLTFILLLSVTIATAQNPESRIQYPVSFLITIKTGNKTSVFKHATIATADSLLRSATSINTGISGLLQNSPFFEIRTQQTWFYCEEKPAKNKKKFRDVTQKKQFPDPTNINNVTDHTNINNVTDHTSNQYE